MGAKVKVLGLTVLAALGLAAGSAQAAASPCESLTNLKLDHVTITSATVVQNPPIAPGGGAGLPTYCKVMGTSRPTSDSDIRFEVAIPEGEAWNGRYLQVGNGGFAGTIPVPLISLGLRAGYTAAGTDDGHQSVVGTDASWALNHPEKGIDFGYRALKETTLAARDSITYFDKVQAKMGDTGGFYRLFMVPGMLHCGGGRGPNDVILPALAALSTWVEKGEAPARIEAAHRAGAGGLGAPGPVEYTRPVCPFPEIAIWDGKGDRKQPQSWRCSGGKKKA